MELPWQPNTQTGKSKMCVREEYCVTRLMSLHRQLEELQTISFLSAVRKVLPFHRRKSTGNPDGMKYAWEITHESFQRASPIHDAEMIRSKWWT